MKKNINYIGTYYSFQNIRMILIDTFNSFYLIKLKSDLSVYVNTLYTEVFFNFLNTSVFFFLARVVILTQSYFIYTYRLLFPITTLFWRSYNSLHWHNSICSLSRRAGRCSILLFWLSGTDLLVLSFINHNKTDQQHNILHHVKTGFN